MRQALLKGMFSGYKVGNQQVEISLLYFAYDTLFFTKESMQNITCMKAIMRIFELVSRLKVNFFMSGLGGIGVDMSNIHRYAHILNCNVIDALTFCLSWYPNWGNWG